RVRGQKRPRLELSISSWRSRLVWCYLMYGMYSKGSKKSGFWIRLLIWRGVWQRRGSLSLGRYIIKMTSLVIWIWIRFPLYTLIQQGMKYGVKLLGLDRLITVLSLLLGKESWISSAGRVSLPTIHMVMYHSVLIMYNPRVNCYRIR